MNENKFHFGWHDFEAVPVKDEPEVRSRCYKCYFYALFCLEKRRAGVIPQCECFRRKDGNYVFFKEKKHGN